MALPNVKIELQNGALGSIGANQDGIAALVVTGTAVSNKIALNEPHVVYSMADVEALGILKDGANSDAWRHINEFYRGYRLQTGNETAELYIMLKSNTDTLTDIADPDEENGAVKLLNYAQGRVRLLGITRSPGIGYTPVVTGGIDQDTLDALTKAQDLGNTFAGKQAPIRIFVEGRGFEIAHIGDLADLKTYTYNRVAVVLWSTKSDGSASVGYTLGLKAGLPVQRKISRVKNGPILENEVYVGDTDVVQLSDPAAFHDKGYIVLRTYPTRAGYYLSGEPAATADTDDYAIIARGCVIDKAQRLAYDVFLQEVEDDIQVDENGQLLPGYKMYLENRVRSRIIAEMSGAISGEPAFSIPDGQNILSDSTTRCVLKITPVGYQSQIEVKLGFQNPALN